MKKMTLLFVIAAVAFLFVTGGGNTQSQDIGTKKAKTRARGATVTGNRLWQCPKCGKILEKGGLGKYWNPGDSIRRVAGTATCGKCMSRYDQADVYGGMYDVEEKAKDDPMTEFDGTVSVIVYQLATVSPPTNAKEICQELLKRKYPKAKLDDFYCIGRKDARITPDEGLVQYKELLNEGKLLNLGTQFSTLSGKDITGKGVVVLFFKK